VSTTKFVKNFEISIFIGILGNFYGFWGFMSNHTARYFEEEPIKISRTELGERLSFAIEKIGGNRAASQIAGVTSEQIGTWKKGGAKIPLEAGAKLAAAAKVRLDWLAHGQGPRDEDMEPSQASAAPFDATVRNEPLDRRLNDAHDIYDAAVKAAGFQPSRELAGMLVALILKGHFSHDQVEDVALFLDVLKRERNLL